jgi:hypothetical protein
MGAVHRIEAKAKCMSKARYLEGKSKRKRSSIIRMVNVYFNHGLPLKTLVTFRVPVKNLMVI